jgi:serine/threonine-protein kinase
VFWQAADGTGAIDQLTSATESLLVPHAITPDGSTVVLGSGSHLAVAHQGDWKKITYIAQAQGIQGNAALSPDGRWLAYNSTESGQPQIYVRPFPNVDAGKWQISTDGGVKPVWARNGQEVFYLGLPPDSRFMSVQVRTTDTLIAGNATKLFDARDYYQSPPGRTYDVSPDGQRVLMIKGTQPSESRPARAILILNWFTELQQRVPTR